MPRFAPILSALLVPLILAACSTFSAEDNRKCPQIRIDRATASLVQFRPGPGKDITDIVMEGEVAGYGGECVYDDEGVEVTLSPQFGVFIGPASVNRTASFSYFIAIPAFFPDPGAKQIFNASVTLPANISRGEFVGEQVTINIPLDPNRSAENMEIFLGFQLTAEQLQHNRTRSVR
ncbi:MAG: hypothetical protein ACPGOY_09165 [Rhodospirillaceae bacterium]